MIRFYAAAAAVCAWACAWAAAAELSQEERAFFENEIRPVLAERCYACHTAEAGALGGVVLDTKEGAANVLIPGKPGESRLIRAIRHEGDIHMPPDGKLPADVVREFERWVAMGAPDPRSDSAAPAPITEFNLEERAQWWSFQPVQDPAPPAVQNEQWPNGAVDRFILAQLEENGLEPAPRADRKALIRRLKYGLTGLPPTPEEARAFLNDGRPDAYERLVDETLASPHFGERWARHWMDLVRYAESRGHESDGSIRNAWIYRDYLIRAFNADLPYDRFIMEHLAGDLISEPRLHPTDGYNESALGTGFYHLGETTHSPVDIRQNEDDRLDNMIDVASKTFLSLTVACARCHDHKFDAVSTKDYYAFYTILASSRFANRDLYPARETDAAAKRMDELRPRLAESFLDAQAEAVQNLGKLMLAAAEAIRDADIARRSRLQEKALPNPPRGEPILFADFEQEEWGGKWTARGEAFGSGPAAGALKEQPAVKGAQGKRFANSGHGGVGAVGSLTSAKFVIERDFINLRIAGGTYSDETAALLIVNGKIVRIANGQGSGSFAPAAWDVSNLLGETAYIDLADWRGGENGYLLVDHIEFSDAPAAPYLVDRRFIDAAVEKYGQDPDQVRRLVRLLANPYRELYQTEELPSSLMTGHAKALYLWFEKTINSVYPEGPRMIRCYWSSRQRPTRLSKLQKGDTSGWYFTGRAFQGEQTSAGNLALRSHSSSDTSGGVSAHRFVQSGLFSGRSDKLPGAARSRTFLIERDLLSVEAMGQGAQIRVILNNFQLIRDPLYGQLDFRKLNAQEPEWRTFDLSRWKGQRAYVEILHNAGEGNFVCVSEVVAHNEDQSLRVLREWRRADNPHESLKTWVEGNAQHGDIALLNALLELKLIGREIGSGAAEEYRKAAAEIPMERGAATSYGLRSRLQAPGMADGNGLQGYVHLRGRYDLPGEPVERRFLEALSESDAPFQTGGSGRLEWARAVADPQNPLAARSFVNRVWGHLFGRGIVPTVDNFGRLGEPPSHPELLDHLASGFVEDGWSVKRLIRRIVLSETYRMSAARSERAKEIDPDNRLLQSMPVRRLDAEAARDGILAAAGTLDRTMYGESVPVHLNRFMNGMGRPGRSGPLDGAGRRSVYIAVRRNFLPAMLSAFDFPVPFSAFGRRNVTNVPAQSLALMNDPFVLEQAKRWGEAAAGQAEMSAAERVEDMYLRAFARPPSAEERSAALQFLQTQAEAYGIALDRFLDDARPWADLAHALFNSKEFIYLY